jgi:hypothetical protein
MYKFFFLISFFTIINIQSQKEITSKKKSNDIVLDGNLSEPDWIKANWTSGFTQMKPFPGKKASKKDRSCYAP